MWLSAAEPLFCRTNRRWRLIASFFACLAGCRRRGKLARQLAVATIRRQVGLSPEFALDKFTNYSTRSAPALHHCRTQHAGTQRGLAALHKDTGADGRPAARQRLEAVRQLTVFYLGGYKGCACAGPAH